MSLHTAAQREAQWLRKQTRSVRDKKRSAKDREESRNWNARESKRCRLPYAD
jgi:hypothetical protein